MLGTMPMQQGEALQGMRSVLGRASSPTVLDVARLFYRPLQPADYTALKAIHGRLFPLDYEDSFFQKAVHGQDRVFSWAAFYPGREDMIGFVTARILYMHECDPTDRQYMGLSHKGLDAEPIVYVLTLGVAEDFRQLGIATLLLELVHQHATRLRARAVFLHVIQYNEGAMRLYARNNYVCVGRLSKFYLIATGRQPDVSQTLYDAMLYVLYLQPPGACGGAMMGGGSAAAGSMALWGAGVLNGAAAPLRNAWGHFNLCVPLFCRQALMFGPPPPPAPPSTPLQHHQVMQLVQTYTTSAHGAEPQPQLQHPSTPTHHHHHGHGHSHHSHHKHHSHNHGYPTSSRPAAAHMHAIPPQPPPPPLRTSHTHNTLQHRHAQHHHHSQQQQHQTQQHQPGAPQLQSQHHQPTLLQSLLQGPSAMAAPSQSSSSSSSFNPRQQ